MKKKTGKIGIFWVYQGEVLARPMPLDQGEQQGEFIDCTEGHVYVWEEANAFRDRFPELAGRDYEEIPRGRVLYDEGNKQFVIYLDECLMNAKNKAALRKAFNLVKEECVFGSDDHYCTDPSRIDDLFA